MNSSEFFCNSACEYFPCHKGVNESDFNCMFCFCPLYALGDECGGNFVYTKNGFKDCSNCNIPHRAENYEHIIEKSKLVAEKFKKSE